MNMTNRITKSKYGTYKNKRPADKKTRTECKLAKHEQCMVVKTVLKIGSLPKTGHSQPATLIR